MSIQVFAPVFSMLPWLSALGAGVMAGIYFAFSSFIMRSLAVLPPQQGIAAMQSINEVILSSSFIPLFAGTTLLSLVLGGYFAFGWQDTSARWVVVGSIVYVVGMFLCTALGNVPLNDALAAVDPTSAEGARVWAHYLKWWTFWNHVRTVACVFASVFFIAAIAAETR